MTNSLTRLLTCFTLFAAITLAVPRACANTPGTHTVKITWIASNTSGVTYNVYRGTAAGVCSGTPTPYASNISPTSFTDSAPPSGTVFYAISAVGPTGESACVEGSGVVPAISTQPPATITIIFQ